MNVMRKKDGFTLIELLIVILTGSIVTMAATTVLLLAFRINRKSLDTIRHQSVTRIMLSVLEDMSSDGEYVLVNNATQNPDGSLTSATQPNGSEQEFWSINREDEINPALSTPLITYTPPMGGASGKIVSNGGQTLVDDITDSKLYKTYSPFDYVKDLYTFSVEIEGKTYDSTVYSRTQEEDWYANDPLIDYENARKVLMEVASSQIGSSGDIMEVPGTSYAKWYSDNYGHWSAEQIETVGESAWCGCFVSWALNKVNLTDRPSFEHPYVTYIDPIPQEANVNFLWLETFAQSGSDSLRVYGDGYIPKPGDLIFFTDVREHYLENLEALRQLEEVLHGIPSDELQEAIQHEMDLEKGYYYIHLNHSLVGLETLESCCITKEAYDALAELNASPDEYYEPYNLLKHFLGAIGDGLDHVGIVAKVKDGYVYTVEGNVRIGQAAPKVVMRKYPLMNPTDEQTGSFIQTGEPLRIFGYATLDWAGTP